MLRERAQIFFCVGYSFPLLHSFYVTVTLEVNVPAE